MAKKINETGEFDVIAKGEAEYLDYIDGCDLIMVGPQIRHMVPTIKKETNGIAPVISINPVHYGTMNVVEVIKAAKAELGEN